MSIGRNVEFANFTCRFGSRHVLLDFADEIVIPAFKDTDLRRCFGDITYFLHNVQLLNLGSNHNPVGVLAGRIVKTTSVEREQTWKDGNLVKDHQSLDSAPSALFVLVLNNHKLIYLPETKDAPSLDAFRALSHKFISEKYKNFLSIAQQRLAANGQKVSRRDVIKDIPPPNVEVIALSSKGSLEDFIGQFDILNEVRIRLIDPNDELDNEELFDDLLQSKSLLGAKTTELVHRNPDGLSKDNAIEQLSGVVQRGNTEVRVGGKDQSGGTLRGNNENFKFKISVDAISASISDAARKLYEVFMSVVSKGVLQIGTPAHDTGEKVRAILKNNA